MKLKIINRISAFLQRNFKFGKSVRRFANVEQLREIMPDLLHGYLSEEEMPNSLLLLSPPPLRASEAYDFDLEYAKKAVESKDSFRFLLAVTDANLSFPAAVKSFEAVLGFEITEVKTPRLYVFMRRVMTDAGLSTYAAKNYYNRERPFVVNKSKTCTPEQEAVLRKVGSFPSGHAAVGWAWSLVFSEIFPDKEELILKRGLDFGESRIVCNAHWFSDVEKGRVMGEATVRSLFKNDDFLNDFANVREEVFRVLDSVEDD